MAEATFAPGEQVFVPWGLDVVEGTVLDSKGAGPDRRIVVEVMPPEVENDSEPLVMTFRPEELKAAAEDANERRPGSWLSAVRYEESLRHAIMLLLDRWSKTVRDTEPPRLVEDDNLADFTLITPDHLLLIEAKAPVTGQVQGKALDQLWSHALRVHSPLALLVTNADLSESATKRLEELLRSGAKIQVVHWSSLEDNDALGSAIEEVLAAS